MISIAKFFFVKVTIQAILPNCLRFVLKRKTNHPGVSGPGSKKNISQRGIPIKGWMNMFHARTVQNMPQDTIYSICIFAYVNAKTLEVQDETKWLVFRMIHVWDSLLSWGKVWSTCRLGLPAKSDAYTQYENQN